MSLGILGSKSLFSLLQTGITHSKANGMRLTAAMKAHLAHDFQRHPTSIAESVPDKHVALGPVDASGEGMGRAWLPANTHNTLEPVV